MLLLAVWLVVVVCSLYSVALLQGNTHWQTSFFFGWIWSVLSTRMQRYRYTPTVYCVYRYEYLVRSTIMYSEYQVLYSGVLEL